MAATPVLNPLKLFRLQIQLWEGVILLLGHFFCYDIIKPKRKTTTTKKAKRNKTKSNIHTDTHLPPALELRFSIPIWFFVIHSIPLFFLSSSLAIPHPVSFALSLCSSFLFCFHSQSPPHSPAPPPPAPPPHLPHFLQIIKISYFTVFSFITGAADAISKLPTSKFLSVSLSCTHSHTHTKMNAATKKG